MALKDFLNRLKKDKQSGDNVQINYYAKEENSNWGFVNLSLRRNQQGNVILVKSINVREDYANTAVKTHEQNHYASSHLFELPSANGQTKYYEVRSGFSIDTYNEYLQRLTSRGTGAAEGATQFLSIYETLEQNERIPGRDISCFNGSMYQSEVIAMGAVAHAIGIEKFKQLYKSANVEELESTIDNVMGSNYYNELRHNLDIVTCNNLNMKKTKVPNVSQVKDMVKRSRQKAERMGFEIWSAFEKNRFINNVKENINGNRHITTYIEDICREEKEPNLHADSHSINSTRRLDYFRSQIRSENRMYANALYLDAKKVPEEKRTANLAALNLLQEEYSEGRITIDDIRDTTFSLSSNPKLGNMLFISRNGQLEVYDIETIGNSRNTQQHIPTIYLTRDLNSEQDLTPFEASIRDVFNNHFASDGSPDKKAPQIHAFSGRPDLFAVHDDESGLNVYEYNREQNTLETIEVEPMEKLHGMDDRPTIKDKASKYTALAKKKLGKIKESVTRE